MSAASIGVWYAKKCFGAVMGSEPHWCVFRQTAEWPHLESLCTGTFANKARRFKTEAAAVAAAEKLNAVIGSAA